MGRVGQGAERVPIFGPIKGFYTVMEDNATLISNLGFRVEDPCKMHSDAFPLTIEHG